MSKGLNERSRFPIFVIGSLMMILPAYMIKANFPIPTVAYEFSVGIGFILFIVSIAISLFGEKITYE